MQEYVQELAQSLIDIDKNPQDVVAADKIKRLCNEAVSSAVTSLFLCGSSLLIAQVRLMLFVVAL